MVTYRRRRTLVIAIILMSLGRAEAVAQTNESVEVSVGIGALAAGGTSPYATALHLGGVAWVDKHWGVAAQHARTSGDGFALNRGAGLFEESGNTRYEYWMATGRYRGFLNNGVELIVGLGVHVVGFRERRVHERRPRPDVAEFLTEEHSALLGTRQERSRERWGGPTLALELLVGKKFSNHVGIGAGAIRLRDFDTVLAVHHVLYASIWF